MTKAQFASRIQGDMGGHGTILGIFSVLMSLLHIFFCLVPVTSEMRVTSKVWTRSLCQLIRAVFVLGNEFPSTRVKLNDSATLNCPEPCGGRTQWKRGADIVAECGWDAQTGFQFTCTIEEGRSLLTVPQVSYSTRGHYSVYCDSREMSHCRQLLQPLPDQSTLELEAGQNLRLDFHTSDPVIVTVRTPGNSSIVQRCSVDGRVMQCHPDYQNRVCVTDNIFMLMDLKLSDSGSYTVEEKEGVTVSISNVTVKAAPWRNMLKAEYWTGFGHGAAAVGVGVLAAVVLVKYAKFEKIIIRSNQNNVENGQQLTGDPQGL